MTVKRLNPMGQDKLIRATQALVMAESGRIWFPEPGVRPGMPLMAIESELLLFTGVDRADEYSDCVDMISYAAKVIS